MFQTRVSEVKQQSMADTRRGEIAQYLSVIGGSRRRPDLDLQYDRVETDRVDPVIATKHLCLVLV